MSEYLPSPSNFAADHVRRYEESGGTDGGDLNGVPCVIVTHTGRKTGGTRKTPLIRVTDGDNYILVASMGGAPRHPQWFHNIRDNSEVTLQDGQSVREMRARLIDESDGGGAEKARLWAVAVSAFPAYAEYQDRTERSIPVFLLEPR